MSFISILLAVDGFDPTELAFKSASDLAQQLITLSTSILALTITFTKDILKNPSQKSIASIKIAWLVYLLSIIFGIWTLMAVTGTLAPINHQDCNPKLQIMGNIRFPAALQIISFIIGTALIIWYGFSSLRKEM
jgi:hypothetical protein